MVTWEGGPAPPDLAPAPPDLRQLAARMGERELETRVIAMIADRGLYLKDHPDSRRDRVSNPGFPDLVIAGVGGVLWRELKDQEDTPSADQLAWGQVLGAAGQDWALWRPLQLLTGVIAIELDALCVRYDPATIGRPAATGDCI